MVVIGQDDTAAGPDGTSHRLDNGERVGDMLEQITGVHQVEGTPLFGPEAEDEGRLRA